LRRGFPLKQGEREALCAEDSLSPKGGFPSLLRGGSPSRLRRFVGTSGCDGVPLGV